MNIDEMEARVAYFEKMDKAIISIGAISFILTVLFYGRKMGTSSKLYIYTNDRAQFLKRHKEWKDG
jgi:hypothetical protein